MRAALLLETRATLGNLSGRADPAVDLRAALELVPAGLGDAPGRGCCSARPSTWPSRTARKARVAAEEALSLARQVGDAATQVSALCELACIESHCGNDPAALAMLGEARSLAGRAGALRPLLHVAINESHVLEGMGEHGRAAEVARAGIASASGLRPGPARPAPSWRSTWPSRWSRSAAGMRPSTSSSMPWCFPRRGSTASRCGMLAGHIALRRGDLAGAQELADTVSAGLSRAGKQGCREAQYYLPLAQLEAELFLAEGRPADARDVVTAAADRFDLVHDARYAWPLLAVGARACAAPATVRGPAAAEPAGDLLGRLSHAGREDGRLGPSAAGLAG